MKITIAALFRSINAIMASSAFEVSIPILTVILSEKIKKDQAFDDICSEIAAELFSAEDCYSNVINQDDPRKDEYSAHSKLLENLAGRLYQFTQKRKRKKDIKGILKSKIAEAAQLLKRLADNIISILQLNYQGLMRKSQENIQCADRIRVALNIC